MCHPTLRPRRRRHRKRPSSCRSEPPLTARKSPAKLATRKLPCNAAMPVQQAAQKTRLATCGGRVRGLCIAAGTLRSRNVTSTTSAPAWPKNMKTDTMQQHQEPTTLQSNQRKKERHREKKRKKNGVFCMGACCALSARVQDFRFQPGPPPLPSCI